MGENFSSQLYSVEELLKNEKDSQDRGKNYYIPRYQRRYVWTTEHVTKLISDIMEILERQGEDGFKDYFIGGIVLSRNSIEGEERSRKSLEVIDGQQRLTTIVLIIAVLYKHIECRRESFQNIPTDILERYKNRLKSLLIRENIKRINRNGRIERNVERSYIVERNDSLAPVFERVINLLLDGENRCDLCSNKSLEDVFDFPLNEYQKNLLNIVCEIDSFFSDKDEGTLLDFCDQFLNNTKLVVTKTNDVDTGFLVFEKLNDSGITLKPEDLLKNFLFFSANETEYSTLSTEWERLLEIINNINPSRTKIQPREFLEDYLTIKGIEIVSRGNNPIFTTFKALRTENYEDSLSLLGDLIRVAAKYKELKRDTLVQKYLNLINFNLGFKILLSFYEVLGEGDFEFHKKRILLMILRLAVVYMIADKTKKLSEIVPELCKTIVTESGNIEKVNSWISEKIDSYLSDFETNIEVLPLYRKKKKLTKLLLSIANYHLEGTKVDSNNISVEHILPQTPNFGECRYSDITEENYKNYVHRIGNLTLVDRSFNSSSRNSCFEEKINALKSNQNIYITRSIKEEIVDGTHEYRVYRQKFHEFFRPLGEEEMWGKEAIENRSKAFKGLLKFILIDNNGSNFKLSYFD
ncbi:DUF262 domain-containing protein [Phorcysia thermohydrogeniphila]|uniref:Uncharacterized protein DUF1524 n=1 Tax=Phorcysia thermohydrogeniphila TaxID=936138 RepID=A0A4R1G8V9_9BACT|nr:DUF262 domain-containing protein [Phorcysia thermohydrogeniphila]TCK02905.1 uncharacterized protein DUF1524 [Phorcysia thermohydrogeniphila]